MKRTISKRTWRKLTDNVEKSEKRLGDTCNQLGLSKCIRMELERDYVVAREKLKQNIDELNTNPLDMKQEKVQHETNVNKTIRLPEEEKQSANFY